MTAPTLTDSILGRTKQRVLFGPNSAGAASNRPFPGQTGAMSNFAESGRRCPRFGLSRAKSRGLPPLLPPSLVIMFNGRTDYKLEADDVLSTAIFAYSQTTPCPSTARATTVCAHDASFGNYERNMARTIRLVTRVFILSCAADDASTQQYLHTMGSTHPSISDAIWGWSWQ